MFRAKTSKVKEGESKSDRWTGKIDICEAQEYTSVLTVRGNN